MFGEDEVCSVRLASESVFGEGVRKNKKRVDSTCARSKFTEGSE